MRRHCLVAASAASLLAAAWVADVAAVSTRDAVGRRTVFLGRSVDGRAITAVETSDFDNPVTTLVVGCIHGDECAGIAVAERLAVSPPPPETDLWVVTDLNPERAAARTRTNAHGVDLNRNFPWRWTRLGGIHYSGPRPLSEPETRIAYRLIERVWPSVSIWFHQHLDVVDDSNGTVAIERRFARAAGLGTAPLAREPGSAVSWESHRFPRSTAFVVELPAGSLPPTAVTRLAHAGSIAATASICGELQTCR